MKTFIYDEFSPEDTAMMQALYSRSAQSVEEHVKKVRATGSGKFMETYYVGYGHASIADCGSTTIFIEGVSTLADKAVQDWPLYSGQETSSRYIDFSQQAVIDPMGSAKSKKILADWMSFYTKEQGPVQEHLRTKYPCRAGEDNKVYERAIKARSFDILRGFLPAGVTTQLSWHTNLRQAADKLHLLKHHPLKEVRDLAEQILAGLKQCYPNSFGHLISKDQEQYRDNWGLGYNYFSPTKHPVFKASTNIKPADLLPYKKLLTTRPPKTGLPHFLTEAGNVVFDFLLDYGSFRDLQRHRNGVCRIPLLTARFGFGKWYLEQLPPASKKLALALIAKQKRAVAALKTSPEVRQYYLAMGFLMPCRVSYALPAAVYVAELRSGRAVHPTMRAIAQQMCRVLAKRFPLLKLHGDFSADDWDIRRGEQTITEKKRNNQKK